ncbi:MAG: FKBP-type peptidyl-prolyl cis-trans isomerase [Flavobacteriaceae bacterium]
MKKLSILLLAIITLNSCNKEPKKSSRTIVIGDTITTKSGLKYVFLKEGLGRKIEEGSKVSINTNLYLNKDTTAFWTTSSAADSLFTFIHKKDSLIRGFKELHNYLHEGDEVAAVIPFQLAYGPTERRGIPAKSTLIYNPLTVKAVSEPKEVMIDTLYTIAKLRGGKVAVSFYKNASDSEYHKDLNLMGRLLQRISSEKMFTALENLSKFFKQKSTNDQDKQQFSYYEIFALEKQGKLKEAIEILEPLTKQESNQTYWKSYLTAIQGKLKKGN